MKSRAAAEFNMLGKWIGPSLYSTKLCLEIQSLVSKLKLSKFLKEILWSE